VTYKLYIHFQCLFINIMAIFPSIIGKDGPLFSW